MVVSQKVRSRAVTVSLLALVTAAAIGTAPPAQAQLTLTTPGTALGFTLSTFASGFSNDSGHVGPLGIAFTSSGGVLVAETFGSVSLFSDKDGQSEATAKIGHNYGFANATGLATVGSAIYMTQRVNQDVVQINSDGTFNQTIAGGLGPALGIAADPTTGLLFVSNGLNKIAEVNPITKTETAFVTGVNIDGLSVSSDGATLYGADEGTGHILGFNTGTGVMTFDSGFVPGGVDGIASGYGKLDGDIFVNTNNGKVLEVNLATDAQTVIATGGSRGDFVTADPNNGTLLLTQSNSIVRLTAGTGSGFAPVPEASTIVSSGLLMFVGLGTLLAARKRTRKA